MYTLKSIARRGTSFAAAMALVVSSVGSAVLPAMSAYADALNPLTDRSLTLSSSSPGWANTDGSGNSTYAPPNSGANGQKTGNYFDFKVSSADTVKSLSFQYCTKSAGACEVPGNDGTPGDDTDTTSDLNAVYNTATEISGTPTAGAGTIDVTSASDQVVGTGTSFTTFLKVNSTFKTAGGVTYVVKSIEDNTHLTISAAAGTTETGVAFSKSDFGQIVDTATGAVRVVPGYTNNNAKYSGTGDPAEAAKDVAGNYIVMYNNGGVWTQSTGWTVSAHNIQNADTGNGQIVRPTNNYLVLTNTTGQAFTIGQQVKVLFFATGSNYITNPGEGAFFVKINTYKVAVGEDRVDYDPLLTGTFTADDDFAPAMDRWIIDGGVTVANVMNQSIQITTKVLETMQFSVGTVDPNTLSSDTTGGTVKSEMDTAYGTAIDGKKHTVCDTILTAMDAADTARNVLQLGNQAAESSLETDNTYSTHSYWRLSSNSSAGATVYYSGHTLSNTVGDEIKPIGPTKATPQHGGEQFGLALDNTANANDTTANGVTPEYDADKSGTLQNFSVNYAQNEGAFENANDQGKTAIHTASLTTDGVLSNPSWHAPRLYPLVATPDYNDGTGAINSSPTTQFAFDPMSDTVPVALASEHAQVVDCVTAKMRYIANIAATTPAGIYTTKINYIAAPQY